MTETAKYLLQDTETTGLDPAVNNLLQAYFLITDKNLEQVADLELQIKHPLYVVAPEALRANKISLADHDGVKPEEAKATFFSWLHANCAGLFEPLADNPFKKAIPKDKKLMPVGQNVPFDIGFVSNGNLIDKKVWGEYVSYHFMDTCVIAATLQHIGILPADLSLSLQSLAKYFGVNPGKAHTAKDDTLTTLEVFKQLTSLLVQKPVLSVSVQ